MVVLEAYLVCGMPVVTRVASCAGWDDPRLLVNRHRWWLPGPLRTLVVFASIPRVSITAETKSRVDYLQRSWFCSIEPELDLASRVCTFLLSPPKLHPHVKLLSTVTSRRPRCHSFSTTLFTFFRYISDTHWIFQIFRFPCMPAAGSCVFT